VALAAGFRFSLGLKADGSIVGWGENVYGQRDVPGPNANFVAVAAGASHCLGLRVDGSVVAWGWNSSGECSVPAPNTDFVAIAAGFRFSLGLESNGSIVAWGNNDFGQCRPPLPNTSFVAVSAGTHVGVAIRGTVIGVTFLDLVAREGPGQVQLRWSLLLDRPGSLQVWRSSTEKDGYAPIGHERFAPAGRSTASYQDTSVEPAREYFYELACREAETWSFSAPVRVVTSAPRLAVWPMGAVPARGGAMQLGFELDRRGFAELDVFDVTGRKVRSLVAGPQGPGPHVVRWDGRGHDGRPVASGVRPARP
jgi:hypothetical protein